MFRAKVVGDGEFCNMKAAEMASRLNSGSGTFYLEESLVAAAIAIPPVNAVAPPRPEPTQPPTALTTLTSGSRTVTILQEKSSGSHVLGQGLALVSPFLIFLTN